MGEEGELVRVATCQGRGGETEAKHISRPQTDIVVTHLPYCCFLDQTRLEYQSSTGQGESSGCVNLLVRTVVSMSVCLSVHVLKCLSNFSFCALLADADIPFPFSMGSSGGGVEEEEEILIDRNKCTLILRVVSK